MPPVPAASRPRLASKYLSEARTLLLPEWRECPRTASAIHALDCVIFSCCALATHIGAESFPFGTENNEDAHACLLSAGASPDDIDRVLAALTWCQSRTLLEPPPCAPVELWRIATRIFVTASRMVTAPADELSPSDEPDSDADDDDLTPLVVVDIFQGGMTDTLPSPLSICKVEGRVHLQGKPVQLLEEAAAVLALCSKRYSAAPLSEGRMTATVARFERGLFSPLYRVDAAADNGVLFATLNAMEGRPQSTRRVRVPMEDDDVLHLLERVLRAFATTPL